MERDLIKPGIKRGFYPLILSTIIAISSIACGIGQKKSSSPDIPLTPTTIPLEPDLQRFMNSNPTFKEIYEKARERNYGIVLFSPENLSIDIWVRLQRIDLAISEHSEVDFETTKIPAGQKGSQVLLATACNGEYQISVSFDGNNYTILPVPDLNTRSPKETFFLRPSCTRPVTLTFEKPGRT